MRVYHELNLGAGVQSTALALMFDEGRILDAEGQPIHLDVSYFADTGEEPDDVYRHLDWLIKRIKSYPIRVVTKGKLGDDLSRGENPTGQRFAAIPAFTLNETVGQQQRQCSKEYKIAPIEQAVRRDLLGLAPGRGIPAGIQVVQYIGISLDEAGRAGRVMRNRVPKQFREDAKRWDYGRLQKFFETRRMRFGFPLLDRFMTRSDCVTFNATRVPHPVPKSACVFCPYHDDSEWDRLMKQPGPRERIIQIDTALRTPGVIVNRTMDGQLFLHRSCRPIDQVEFDTRETPRKRQLSISFWGECEGVCGV